MGKNRFILGLVLSGLARLAPTAALQPLASPLVFLISYVLAYQQVPPFPPIGATNKIFYLALVATLVGFVLDLHGLSSQPRSCRRIPF
jgi:hypothetical protein